MLLRKEFFASLDTTQVKLVGNLRKVWPSWDYGNGKPKGMEVISLKYCKLYAILVTSFEVWLGIIPKEIADPFSYHVLKSRKDDT